MSDDVKAAWPYPVKIPGHKIPLGCMLVRLRDLEPVLYRLLTWDDLKVVRAGQVEFLNGERVYVDYIGPFQAPETPLAAHQRMRKRHEEAPWATAISERPVTARALAAHFGVTVETVNRWVREERIPFIRVSRRVVRFRLDEVEQALRTERSATATDVR